jgi:1-acyl-sn-glycerol-3-phosphate acyltransferase
MSKDLYNKINIFKGRKMKKIKKTTKYNWFLRLLRRLIMAFRDEPKLILKDPLPEQAIYIANHSGAAGPLTISMYFPKYMSPWGAHPMTEHYFKRWNYLYHIFYQKKLKYSKLRSFLLASLFGIISKTLYNGVQLIPTYTDLRLRKIIALSMRHFEVGNSILIFPEDSDDGYKEEIDEFHGGFVYLAKEFHRKFGRHIPIIPLYYHKSAKEMRVDKSYTLDDFKNYKHRKDIANQFKNILNALGNA